MRRGSWIQVASGGAMFPLDPRPEEIHIEDIAHGISNLCRFTGHTRAFISVAEHSINVSRFCDSEDALHGLLHDAAEAYLSDISSPLKRLDAMEEYRWIERNLQRAIFRKFGLDEDLPYSVQTADRWMLAIEARDLMPPHDWYLPLLKDAPDFHVVSTMPPAVAKERFLQRFHELCK